MGTGKNGRDLVWSARCQDALARCRPLSSDSGFLKNRYALSGPVENLSSDRTVES